MLSSVLFNIHIRRYIKVDGRAPWMLFGDWKK